MFDIFCRNRVQGLVVEEEGKTVRKLVVRMQTQLEEKAGITVEGKDNIMHGKDRGRTASTLSTR